MEVHHHSGNFPHQKLNWKHYFWEFFMLFLAVFCGFLAENQREHILEKRRARQYAQSLINDLQADIQMTTIIMGSMKQYIKVIDSLTSYVHTHNLGQMRNIDLFVLGSIDRYKPFKWSRSTIQQLINSGSLRYYEDPELINKISAYIALTYHLDEDYIGDETRSNNTGAKRDEVVDMSYHPDLIYGLRNNRDSTLHTKYFRDLYSTDTKSILARDIRDIQIFLNNKLNIRRNLYIRSEEELPMLIAQAKTIIALLNKKYHWDS